MLRVSGGRRATASSGLQTVLAANQVQIGSTLKDNESWPRSVSHQSIGGKPRLRLPSGLRGINVPWTGRGHSHDASELRCRIPMSRSIPSAPASQRVFELTAPRHQPPDPRMWGLGGWGLRFIGMVRREVLDTFLRKRAAESGATSGGPWSGRQRGRTLEAEGREQKSLSSGRKPGGLRSFCETREESVNPTQLLQSLHSDCSRGSSMA